MFKFQLVMSRIEKKKQLRIGGIEVVVEETMQDTMEMMVTDYLIRDKENLTNVVQNKQGRIHGPRRCAGRY